MEDIKELRSSLAIPSAVNSYSMGIEYMKNWFLKKFNKDYFKTVHIDGKHISDDFKKFSNTESLKKMKPSVAIIPRIDFEFDRDSLDNYLYSKSQYIRRSKFDSSFFKDVKRNMYLSIGLDQLKMDFTFRVRVSTRAQQVDLYKFMNMAYRIGATQEEFIDMDFHIPHSLMLQVASDAGFEIKDDKIIDPIKFVGYLNEHSVIPVLYKYRTINGKSEFFLRFSEMYVHISCLDKMSADDGEREGMLNSNYVIEMNATLKMPAPKRYMYYSLEEHDKVNGLDSDINTVGLFNIRIPNIPDTNEKGWQTFLTTECYEEDLTKPLTIEFKELFENSDIGRVIDHHMSIHINPSLFIDFKLFNDAKEIEYEIDWKNYLIITNKMMEDHVTNISIYSDMKYVFDYIIQLNEMDKNRMIPTKNREDE